MLAFVEPSAGGDAAYYLAAAQHGPDLFRPPLYPLFLSPFLKANILLYVAQSALTIGAALLCFRLTGSFWSGALIACCPFLIIYEYSVLAESLLIALLLTGWLLLDRSKPVWAGVCIGLAILTNDVFLLLPFFSLPIGWWLCKTRQFTAMAVTAYFVALPWASYNLVAHDRFVLSDGRMGFNLWVGTWERNGEWLSRGVANPPDLAFQSEGEKAELIAALHANDDAPFQRVALSRITGDPIETARNWSARYWHLWIGTRTDQAKLRLKNGSSQWKVLKSAMWGLNLIVLLGGCAALVATGKWIYGIPVLYVAVIYIPFHNTETRYSLPALAFLLIPLGAVIDQWIVDTKKPAAKGGGGL